LLFTCSHAQTSRIYRHNGRLQTTYLGSRESRLLFRIYDKSAERRSCGDHISPNVIRVEAEIKPRCLLRNLQSISNSFERLCIGRTIDPLHLPANDYMKVYFFHYARDHGLHAALRRLPKNQRKEMKSWYETHHSERWHNHMRLSLGVNSAIERLLTPAPFRRIRRRIKC